MDGSNLTSDGQKELKTFLNFFNLKKQEALNEVQLDIQEFIDTQVQETIYNKDDVCDLLNKLHKSISIITDKEISKIIHMSGVYVKIFQSVAADLNFHADFNYIENIHIIDQMKILEKGGSIVEESSQQKSVKYSRLPTLDVGMQKHVDDLIKDSEQLKQYNLKLQNELILLKKGTAVDADLAVSLEQQISDLKQQNQSLTAELDKKLSESAQFRNLKQMIQEKNQQIKELQIQLQSKM